MTRSLDETLSEILERDVEAMPTSLTERGRVIDFSRLQSKKNMVFLLRMERGDLILKIFQNAKVENEFSVLISCESMNISAPRPYLQGEDFILMEFLEGPNLCDLINDTMDLSFSEMIADWFVSFHNSFRKGDHTLVKSDAKLHNFILTSNGLAGLDFELAHEGDPLEDLGEVCSHILDTDPMFIQRKFELCEHLLRRYSERSGISLSGVTGRIIEALEEAIIFRPNQREELESWVKKLERGNLAPFCYLDNQKR